MEVADQHAAPRAAPPPAGLSLGQFSFDMPEVEKWAEFSTDRNPIHFDLEPARLAGLDALIVHGMLALMPVKQALSGAMAASGWMKFKALFRNPIPHGRAIGIDARATPAGLSYRACTASGEFEHFRGVYAQVANPTAALEGEKTECRTALDFTQAQRFHEFYPDVRERWIALDAVIFSDFMGSKLHIIEELAHARMMRERGNVPDTKVVVQLSHSVIFDAAFFEDELTSPAEWNKLSYALSMPEMVVNGNQAGGTISLPVVSEGRLVMLMEIGLVSKFDN